MEPFPVSAIEGSRTANMADFASSTLRDSHTGDVCAATGAVSVMELQRALFSPPRFKTLGFLVQVEESDYPSIQEFTGLSISDISRAVGFLDEHDLVHVSKERNGRYPVTVVSASEAGRAEFRLLLKDLKKYGPGLE